VDKLSVQGEKLSTNGEDRSPKAKGCHASGCLSVKKCWDFAPKTSQSVVYDPFNGYLYNR
jgi:hypothetical protein